MVSGWWVVHSMSKRTHLVRVLLILGLTAMLIGAVDPLEGSVVILAGLGVVALGARQGGSRNRLLIYWSLALMVLGVGALYGLSAIRGTGGGGSGRSHWWTLVLVPYPVAWLMGLVGGIRAPREISGRSVVGG